MEDVKGLDAENEIVILRAESFAYLSGKNWECLDPRVGGRLNFTGDLWRACFQKLICRGSSFEEMSEADSSVRGKSRLNGWNASEHFCNRANEWVYSELSEWMFIHDLFGIEQVGELFLSGKVSGTVRCYNIDAI